MRGIEPRTSACKASALPFDLHPLYVEIKISELTRFRSVSVNKARNRKWRCGVSNPVPLACKASAPPFDLHPLYIEIKISEHFISFINVHEMYKTV